MSGTGSDTGEREPSGAAGESEGRYSVAQVSALLNVPIPTIRSWERRYGLVSPARTRGGHRRYATQDVERIRAMRNEIVRGHRPRDVARRLSAAPHVPDGRAVGFVRLIVDGAIDLDPRVIRRSLEESAATMGVEAAITKVALPGLREMGSRWKAGECDPGREHLATHEVRGWLARLSALGAPAYRVEPVLLAAAPTEAHSVALEAFALILARRGWSCAVLGARTPLDSLVSAARRLEPAGVVVTAHWTQARRAAAVALRSVRKEKVGHVFYAGAAFSAAARRRGIPGTYLGQDLLAAARIIEATVAGETRVGS